MPGNSDIQIGYFLFLGSAISESAVNIIMAAGIYTNSPVNKAEFSWIFYGPFSNSFMVHKIIV